MRKSTEERTRSFKKMFKNIGGRYEQNRFLLSLGTRYESWMEIDTVLSNLKQVRTAHNSRILDIGIGTARISKEILRQGHKIIGIDITPEMLKYSQQMLRQLGYGKDCDFVLSSMSHLPFKENCFDGVVSIRTLKYAAHPFKVLMEAHRVLKQEGIFIVEFPNIKTYYSLLILLDKLIGKRKLRVKYFALSDMMECIKKTGFDVLGVKETLRLPRSWYTRVYRKRILQATISIEQALSSLLPLNILTRSFIMTCTPTDKN